MATLQQERKRGREREERRRDEAGWGCVNNANATSLITNCVFTPPLPPPPLSSLAVDLLLLSRAPVSSHSAAIVICVLLLGHLDDAGIQGNRGDVTLVPHVNTNIDKYSSISKRAIMGVMAEASLSDRSINNAVSLESRRKSTRLYLNLIELTVTFEYMSEYAFI